MKTTSPRLFGAVGGVLAACRCAGVVSVLLFVQHVAQAAEVFRVVTEDVLPYKMMRHGRITGLGTDVVEAVLKQAGMDVPIEVMPWARAYETALTEPNVLIYSMSHTPERDPLFKWVGEVGPPERQYFYALKARHLRPTTLDETRAYRIATLTDDVRERFLLANGFVLGKNLSRSNRSELSFEKLKVGHVDLWLAGELTAAYTAESAGDDPAVLLDQVLLVPNVTGGDSRAAMAFGVGTSDALVERFRQALRAIKDNGSFDAIQRKWQVPIRP